MGDLKGGNCYGTCWAEIWSKNPIYYFDRKWAQVCDEGRMDTQRHIGTTSDRVARGDTPDIWTTAQIWNYTIFL